MAEEKPVVEHNISSASQEVGKNKMNTVANEISLININKHKPRESTNPIKLKKKPSYS